jgi:hypothetical protein
MSEDPKSPETQLEERRNHIEQETFIYYPAARVILDDLEEIYRQNPNLRPRNYLLISDTDNGKTHILHEFAKKYPGSDESSAEALERPVLVVECPTKGNLLELYREILRKLNAPFSARSSTAILFDSVLKMLRKCKVRVLVIDEFHSLLSQKVITVSADDFLTQLKYIMNVLRLPIVCAGIETAEKVAKHDPQIWNRFNVGRLPLWKPNANSTVNLLKTLENRWGLLRPSNFSDPELLKYLISSSNGQIGSIVKRVRACAIDAVGTTECVDLKSLKARWVRYDLNKDGPKKQ